jgi:hypothetical protein
MQPASNLGFTLSTDAETLGYPPQQLIAPVFSEYRLPFFGAPKTLKEA